MDKSRPAIIFLHGALGVAQDLEPLMALFRDRGFETLSFNFSGHGVNNPSPQEFRIDLFSRDLEAFIKKNNLKNPVVFGHSMGGYVALYHKANFEDSPIKMIFTYGTKFNWSEQTVKKELPMLNPDHLQEKYPQFVTVLKNKHGDSWRHLLYSTAHMMQHLERLDGLTKEDMAEIDIPVMLILGDQDRMVTSEETHLTSTWLHRAQVKTISHSKHELERSNLKEITELVISHLD